MHRHLFAIDPSLTCSGWAVFSVAKKELLAVGKIRSLPAAQPLAERLLHLQGRVTDLFEKFDLDRKDVLICEEQTTMRDPRAAFRVEQVRGIFEVLGRVRGATVPGRINPRSVQQEVIGLKGKQLERAVVKEAAVMVVQSRFQKALAGMEFDTDTAALRRNQDIVDAVLVGALGLERIAGAYQAEVTVAEYFHQRCDREFSRGRGLRWR